MNATKATYWIALAAFALALNSEYQHGKFPALHSAVNHTESELCQFVTRAEQTFAVARALTGDQRQEFRVDDEFIVREQAQVAGVMAEHQADLDRALAEHQADIGRAMALRQADLDRVQQKLDRMHVVLDRAQFQRVHVLDRVRVKIRNSPTGRTVVVCPKTGARITVRADDDLPDMDSEVSDIEVVDSF